MISNGSVLLSRLYVLNHALRFCPKQVLNLKAPHHRRFVDPRLGPRNYVIASSRPNSSKNTFNEMAEFSVIPTSSFVDEQISIHVRGLRNISGVTIRAVVEENDRSNNNNKGNQKFESYAHFIPDVDGTVEVNSHPSIRGSYRGVMPMGLITHMEPSPGQNTGVRLIKKDVTTPLLCDLTVYNGFLTTEDFYSKNTSNAILAKTTVERWYMSKDVDRIEIRSGNVRGTLFKPKGDGPFPGIIDIFGAGGGIMEFRAALFASHGFAALSLAYFRYQDLTKDPKTVDMEYFEESVDWMCSNPLVMNSGIGIIGVSAGAQAVLKMSVICGEKIKAAVCINGSPFYTPDEPSRLYKGQHYPTLKVSLDNVVIDDGVVNVAKYWPYKLEDIDRTTMMKLEDSSCDFLFIVGEDDKSWPVMLYSKLACEYLQEHGKENWTILSYPGAGHLIEPAYAPLCTLCYFSTYSLSFQYGGNPDDHAIAQEDSWKKILAFFKEHVGTGEPVRTLPSHDNLGMMMIQSKL